MISELAGWGGIPPSLTTLSDLPGKPYLELTLSMISKLEGWGGVFLFLITPSRFIRKPYPTIWMLSELQCWGGKLLCLTTPFKFIRKPFPESESLWFQWFLSLKAEQVYFPFWLPSQNSLETHPWSPWFQWFLSWKAEEVLFLITPSRLIRKPCPEFMILMVSKLDGCGGKLLCLPSPSNFIRFEGPDVFSLKSLHFWLLVHVPPATSIKYTSHDVLYVLILTSFKQVTEEG